MQHTEGKYIFVNPQSPFIKAVLADRLDNGNECMELHFTTGSINGDHQDNALYYKHPVMHCSDLLSAEQSLKLHRFLKKTDHDIHVIYDAALIAVSGHVPCWEVSESAWESQYKTPLNSVFKTVRPILKELTLCRCNGSFVFYVTLQAFIATPFTLLHNMMNHTMFVFADILNREFSLEYTNLCASVAYQSFAALPENKPYEEFIDKKYCENLPDQDISLPENLQTSITRLYRGIDAEIPFIDLGNCFPVAMNEYRGLMHTNTTRDHP